MLLGTYHTKTYVAASFDHDNEAVDKLYEWNENDRFSLSFKNVHELAQCYDSSLYCTIKRSLRDRMSVCKTFVLIVGPHTNAVTKGACFNCASYQTYFTLPPCCSRGHSINNFSYIRYECELALKEGTKIVVLYNSSTVNRSLCPESVRYTGTHVAMKCRKEAVFGSYIDWDYQAVKDAILN